MEEVEEEEQGCGKKEMGHLVDIIALGWPMGLDGHGRSCSQQNKKKNPSTGKVRLTKRPESHYQAVHHLTCRHFRTESYFLVSEHTIVISSLYSEFKALLVSPCNSCSLPQSI